MLSIETGRGIIHAFRDVITEREFPDLRWHDLRHEGISRLFELTDLRDHEIMAITRSNKIDGLDSPSEFRRPFFVTKCDSVSTFWSR